MPNKQTALKELQQIPGVGKSIAQDLWNLGIHSINDLKNKNPESLYQSLMAFEDKHIDRCVLYVFRCAVYYASNKKHNKKLLQWWNWVES